MKRFLSGCLLLLTVVPLWAGHPAATDLLQDPQFARGIRLFPFAPAAGDNRFVSRQAFRNACLPVQDCSQQPVWSLQQWATAQDIAAVPATPAETGGQEWTVLDAEKRLQKRLRLAPASTAAVVWLEMNGESEFAARDAGGVANYLPDLRHPWPHFLLSQDLPGERLSTYHALPLSLLYRIPLAEQQRTVGYDPGIHAARLVLAITVRNRLNGNYFWLTLPLFDDRYAHSSFGCQKCIHNGEQCYIPETIQDPGVWRCPEDRVGDQWGQNPKPGSARMIFRLPTRDFLHVGNNGLQVVEGDLLPYIRAGVEAVRQRHNGKSFPADLFFYELGRFSIGWEVTGLNHVAAEFHSLRLQAVLK